MQQSTALSVCLLAMLALSGCKIEKTVPAEEANAASSAGEAGDDARIAALLENTYESKLLPHIASAAVSVAELRAGLVAGVDAFGAAHGNRGADKDSAWNFAVQGEGKVLDANLTSRARKLMIDTDADGVTDLTLQIGPVIKGTSLRDVAPFYRFSDFRDQIEFAKLGRALNDRAVSGLILDPADPTGRTVRFTGTVDVKSPKDAWLVTPITIAVLP